MELDILQPNGFFKLQPVKGNDSERLDCTIAKQYSSQQQSLPPFGCAAGVQGHTGGVAWEDSRGQALSHGLISLSLAVQWTTKATKVSVSITDTFSLLYVQWLYGVDGLTCFSRVSLSVNTGDSQPQCL